MSPDWTDTLLSQSVESDPLIQIQSPFESSLNYEGLF